MEYLEKTFRWFGPNFGVSLNDIRQTGATGIVTSLHDIPTGDVWSAKEIKKMKIKIESSSMKWSVVESVNIHESIKTASEGNKKYINNYIETLHNLAENNINTVCYNFMPVLDWTRTDLNYCLNDGASALKYDHIALAAFDLFILERNGAMNQYDKDTRLKAKTYLDGLNGEEIQELQDTIMAGLPGTREVLSPREFKEHLKRYGNIDKRQLRQNLVTFLNTIIPEAEKLKIKMCIHPDDPPFSILGLPRAVSNLSDIKFILNSVPSYYNGLTFCTGSLGAISSNDLVKIFNSCADKIHFLHLRSVQTYGNHSFYEANHLEGSTPMTRIMEAIIKEQQRRKNNGNRDVDIPVRPDHGHLLLDDINNSETFYPGYSKIGRLKGLAELSGLEHGIRHSIL